MGMTTAAEAYFAENAGRWDELRASYFGEEVRAAALAHGYLRPEYVVADVGAGTGYIAEALAARVAQVRVIDASPAMLDVARENLARHENVTFHLSDGATLPVGDAAVDAVFANMYLHHCPDPLAAIREMVRILKPGGRLVMTDMERHEHAWMREEMADAWLGFERADVKRWLREAGLVNALVEPTGKQCCGASEQAPERSARINVFVATGARRVAARDAVQARYGATAERLAAEVSEDAEASVGKSCCGGAGDLATEVSEGAEASTGKCCGGAGEAPAEVIELAAGAPLMMDMPVIDLAPVSSSCCCSPTSNEMPEVGGAPTGTNFIWDTGYSPDELKKLPPEVAALALGCGNPTAFASLKPGETVLDIGSGGGIDAFFAASRVGPAGRVIGVDMTPAMLQRARASAAAAGLTHVEFRQGHAEALPVEDGVVDVIMSNCVINLCEDKGQVFEEAFRVLKSGGRLAVSDTVAAGALPISLRHDSGSWGACISGALPEQEYLDLVAAAGFVGVTGQKSLSRGEVAGVSVYSLSVTAVKP
jgi:ubiquinone/menaquinone biosynthesis C-methylase UbiE